MRNLGKKVFIIVSVFFVLLSIYGFTVLSLNWNIDPNYSIKFSGKKAEGTFSGLSGTVKFDEHDLADAKFEVYVKVNTIKTGNQTKDKHAMGESWLDEKKFPRIMFSSTSFQNTKGNQYSVKGMLEFHGVKKAVEIPFMFLEKGNKATFEGKFMLNRKDYGIQGNMFGFVVGDDLEISLKVPVSQP